MKAIKEEDFVRMEEILENTSKNVDEIIKSTSKDIKTRIKNAVGSENSGTRFEGETAKLLDDNNIVILEFAQKHGTHEVDIATENFIIECKTNLNNRSASEIIEQVERLSANTGGSKQIILFSGKTIDYSKGSISEIINALSTSKINYRIIDNPNELINYIK